MNFPRKRLLINLPGKVYAKCLEKRWREILDLRWRSVSFVLDVALWTKFALSNKFLRNRVSMQKTSAHQQRSQPKISGRAKYFEF